MVTVENMVRVDVVKYEFGIIKTNELERVIDLDSGTSVWSLVFSNTTPLTLFSGSNDHGVRLWGAFGGRQIGKSLRKHGDVVTALALHPSGRILASGSDDNTIKLWKLGETDITCEQELVGHKG